MQMNDLREFKAKILWKMHKLWFDFLCRAVEWNLPYCVKEAIGLLISEDETYTLYIVPDDGSEVRKERMDTRNMRKGVYVTVCSVILSCLVVMVGMGVMYNLMNTYKVEKAEYDAFQLAKAKQEKQLKQLEKATEEAQKEMARINALENQIREEMKKSGMQVPAKEVSRASNGPKGGPNMGNASNLEILLKQNENLRNDLKYASANLTKLHKKLKSENYRKSRTPDIWPLAGGYISSSFGSRVNPFDGYSADVHPGIDIAADYGTPVYAGADGYVVHAGWYYGYGKYIKIEHDYGYQTAYGHLSSIETSAGRSVKKGELIGYVGSTGYSTGPHLHYEVIHYGQQVNPMKYIK